MLRDPPNWAIVFLSTKTSLVFSTYIYPEFTCFTCLFASLFLNPTVEDGEIKSNILFLDSLVLRISFLGLYLETWDMLNPDVVL
jgi:hypothetical protein